MTRHLLTTRCVCNDINKDIAAWAKTGLTCQRAKIHHHVAAPLQQFATPDGRFDSIHVDIVGPLPSSRGTSCLYTIVDRFIRWPEAIPMSDATALSCARALLENWLHRFGITNDITSDRGHQFTYGVYVLRTELSKLLGTQMRTSAELVYGKSLRLPGEIFKTTARTTDTTANAGCTATSARIHASATSRTDDST